MRRPPLPGHVLTAARVAECAPQDLKQFGRRWLPLLLFGWVFLQVSDVVLTYWGLTLPTIVEANPLMAEVIASPLKTIAIKATLTIVTAILLLRIEYRTRFSSIPIFLFLNLLMGYVFYNNWTLIAHAQELAGAPFLPRF